MELTTEILRQRFAGGGQLLFPDGEGNSCCAEIKEIVLEKTLFLCVDLGWIATMEDERRCWVRRNGMSPRIEIPLADFRPLQFGDGRIGLGVIATLVPRGHASCLAPEMIEDAA